MQLKVRYSVAQDIITDVQMRASDVTGRISSTIKRVCGVQLCALGVLSIAMTGKEGRCRWRELNVILEE